MLDKYNGVYYFICMINELEVNNLRLSPQEQEYLRFRIIRASKKYLKPNGKPFIKLIAENCECSKNHVRNTLKKYAKGGTSALKAVKMGRPQESGKLTVEQQKHIQKLIVDKCPDQLKMKGFLWDRQSVCDLVFRLYKVTISIQAMGDYLRKWGFSPQRPSKRNYKQNPVAIKQWLDVDYPAIKKRAKTENAEILWGDETSCQNECNYVTGYAPKGQTPVLPVDNSKLRVNMISAISNKGKLRFMFYRESMNVPMFKKFLSRLIKDNNGRKVFLILDNLRVHHATLVQTWVEERNDKIALFFLPPYAPEYNPDEYLNGDLKRSIAKKGYSVSVDELESKARGTMKMLQRDEKHITRYFEAEKIAYAAEETEMKNAV